jgi:tRNA 2-selenouridine synthase
MSYNTIEISAFLELAQEAGSCVFDVRSEGEFDQGHLPGAINFPLLRNEERHEVGICYKKKGSDAAVELGFQLVGPRFAEMIRKASDLSEGRSILVYCWRGGLRSNIVAWLLQTAGFKVTLLKGGYKSWRTLCLELFQSGPELNIIGGPTGVGKTEILEVASQKGVSCLDLERIAQHKGSAFGGLWGIQENTQEHFENRIALTLWNYRNSSTIWVEDESRFVGKLRVPDALFQRMSVSKVCFIERPLEIRVERVLAEYGVFEKEVLAERTRALSKRMGGDQVAKALACLEQGDMEGWLKPLLTYYDKTYLYSFEQRKNTVMKTLQWSNESVEQLVDLIITAQKNHGS